MAKRFCWTAFDVTDLLPLDWMTDIKKVAAEAHFDNYPRTPFLSREAADVEYINRGRVRADAVQQGLPWLYELYRGEFLGLAEQAWREPIKAASDDRYGVVLNVAARATRCGSSATSIPTR